MTNYYATPPTPPPPTPSPPTPPPPVGYRNPWEGPVSPPVTVGFLERQVKNWEQYEPTIRKRSSESAREALARYEIDLPARVTREKELRAKVDALGDPDRTGDGYIDASVTDGRDHVRREWITAALAVERTRDVIAGQKSEIEQAKKRTPTELEPREVQQARLLIAHHHANVNGRANGNGANGAA